MTASFGWDGPGQGSAELSYHIGPAPSELSQAAVDSAIETALRAWSEVIDVEFTETSQPNQRDSLDFSFRSIDGRGGTLAQAYFPDDVNSPRIAGDVQFDVAERWEVGNALGRNAFDLVQVAVHEIGHALGIEHLHTAGSVLAPTVSPNQQFTALSTADVDAALELYAPAETEPVPVVPPIEDSSINQSIATDDQETDDQETEVDPPAETDRPNDNSPRFRWQRFWIWRGFWNRFGSRGDAADSNFVTAFRIPSVDSGNTLFFVLRRWR